MIEFINDDSIPSFQILENTKNGSQIKKLLLLTQLIIISMELSQVNAISPIDGRYRKQTESLAYYFSEAALINYRVFVEIEYFIAL